MVLIVLLLEGSGAWLAAFPMITNVAETGGDNEAMDTVPAKWTGVTFSNGVGGEFLDPFTVPLFGEDVPAFVDRTHQWNGATDSLPLPPYLVGGEYIMSGNDNRDNANYQLDITIAEAALVYILVDNRLSDGDGNTPPDFSAGNMGWLLDNGWTAVTNGFNRNNDPTIPDEVGVDEGGDGTGPGMGINQFSSIYVKTIPAGTFSIFAPDNPSRNMYGVVVQRAPGSPSSPPEIINLSPTNNTLFYPAASGVQFTVTTVAPNTIAPGDIVLSLNGTNVSSNLTVGGTSASRTVSFGALTPDRLYRARIVASDQAGRATTNEFAFDTFLPNTAIAVEVEDYNYERGKFIDPAAPGAYANLSGQEGTDYFDNGNSLATVYRPADFVGLTATADVPRAPFTTAGATDFQVTQMERGEWLNYTRVFPSNSYHLFLRTASTVAQEVRLDRVTGDRAGASQTLFGLGTFKVPNTGGAAAFAYIPLVDGGGNPVVAVLSGTNTLRLTASSANLNLQVNYLLMVPTTPPASLPPLVSAALPSFGATEVSPDTDLEITIANGTTAVSPGTVALSFNGSNVTSSASLAATSDGIVVTFDPAGFLPTNTTQTVSLIFGDTAGAMFSNQWSFTTSAFLPVILPTFGTAPGSGQQPGFALKIRKAPNVNGAGADFTLANNAQRAEQQLADQLIDPDTTRPYINEAAGPSGTGLETNAVINFEQAGTSAGYFAGDLPFPFLDPAAVGDPNNIAMEAAAYLELNAGVYRFGVRSDDGFKLTSGPILSDTNLLLGIYEGGRGAGLPGGATEFEFFAPAAGVYPFRLIWYEGNGGSSLEFYSVNRETGERTLINDPNSPGAIRAFVSRAAQVFVPAVNIVSPANDALFATDPTNITITAEAAVTNGQIAKVEFFQGATNKIGEATNAPFRVIWSNVGRGRYVLTAKATAANGLTALSSKVNIVVGAPLIVNVVETGGDEEATDTVTAKWTGVTFSNGVANEFLEPFTVPVFGEDVPAFVDRAHQWNGATAALPIPGYLLGGEYIMSGNDNRDNSPYQLDVTVSQPVLVYLLVDNRLSDANGGNPPDFSAGNMSWLLENGWTPVTNGLNRTRDASMPDEVGVDEGGDGVGPGLAINQWSSVYLKSVPAGTFSLFQPDNSGQNMYGVVVTTVPTITLRPAFTAVRLEGTTLHLTWTGGGTLQEAAEVTGSWGNVAGNPQGDYLVQASAPRRFYRIVAP